MNNSELKPKGPSVQICESFKQLKGLEANMQITSELTNKRPKTNILAVK
jgi:hypothetical protein